MKRAFVLSLLLVGCSNTKPDVTDDFSMITDEKSDSFSSRMKIVGTLADPSGSVQLSYSAKPLYRAIKLHARAGDLVKITVGPNGKVAPDADQPDPVTFLVDASFRVVAKNDDANAQTRDSQIVTQLKKTGTFYVIVRDYNYATVAFDAVLVLARPSGDLVQDANTWFQFFFTGNDYGDLAARYSVAMDKMPSAAQTDANGFFKTDVGVATGYALPYDGSTMYFLIGDAGDDAYDARPYDADGNPITATAIGGDAGDILFK
jgi:hypothetical protein